MYGQKCLLVISTYMQCISTIHLMLIEHGGDKPISTNPLEMFLLHLRIMFFLNIKIIMNDVPITFISIVIKNVSLSEHDAIIPYLCFRRS